MNSEYRATVAALGVALALLIGAALVTASGLGASVAEEPDDVTVLNQTNETLHVEMIEAGNLSSNGTTVWVQRNRNRSVTEFTLDGTTIELNVDQRDPMFDERDRRRYAERVWKSLSDEADFEDVNAIEIRVDQIFETGAHETPTDEAVVHVRPAERQLPEVTAVTDRSGTSVNVTTVHHRIGEVDVEIEDGLGVLDADDVETIESLATAGGDLSDALQSQFENPQTLSANVTEISDDGTVELQFLTDPDDGSAVGATIDLEDERVRSTWMILTVEDADLSSSSGNESSTVILEAE